MVETSDKVKKIEEEISNFLYNWSFLQRTRAPSPAILNQFIFNPVLTQSEIRERSNFSIAKVYKELNGLVNMKLIKKERNSFSNEVLYSMERIDIALVNYMVGNAEKLIDWIPKFKEMKHLLRKNKSKLEYLNGYGEIAKWTNFFSNILKFYELSYQILMNIKEELEQKGTF